MTDALFGRLDLSSLSIWHALQDPTPSELVAAGAAMAVILGGLGVLVLLTWFRLWGPLWRDWLTSVDHKRIGIMYCALALIMLARGVIEGVLMRTQQAFGLDGGFLTPDHFSQLFSTHGTIMIFFVAMPFIAGVINYVMPLQIGARDMAFPVMNQISLGLTATGAALVMISLVLGKFSTGGWANYPPYTGADFQPGPGPDYWIWAITLAGIGTTLSGINFAVTIYKERAPGMHFLRMPIFCWTVICTSIIMIFALPPLTVAALMLAADRYLEFHFFTNDLGGNMMNYVNLFWLFGHPEVYLLVIPCYGMFSEVITTYSGKRIYGYMSMVYATMSIAVLSFCVWLHHFFTMGQSANVNAAFGIASMAIAVPTGVKIYNWIATLFRGRVRMTVPMIYAVGFFYLFTIGGLTGVMLANPVISYQVHNTLFLVAHFHNVIIPGVLFGLLAGYHYWFPKAFGFRLHEGWGRAAAVLWIVGFSFTFLPLYWLGLHGMPRRSPTFAEPSFQPMMWLALFGAALILSALTCLAIQLWISIRRRDQLAVPLGDPWDGRALEWSIPSPPPPYNFAVVPHVTARDDFAEAKAAGRAYAEPEAYEDIEMPNNTAIGLIVCVCSTLMGVALVFWIWWLAVLSLAVMLLALVGRTFHTRNHHVIPAARVAAEHRAWLAKVQAATAVDRLQETHTRNMGRAMPERPNRTEAAE
ncbi:cytochrome o ubiquinol oxidase subunit 1 [Sagittula marina]|uniref:Cytochrome o ubiquinol oxidase subunit 1 n=1 Tax=Sagittula marina TaxID=943940 RepID=A0A7W6GU33_9RHOB|nr:cbb3-type cytochrome c oxidase subunit I [Sagittula marina]MBB3985879.1 cytochrome o ubiquinol oxidase subunit 1 [Sagittula marina]